MLSIRGYPALNGMNIFHLLSVLQGRMKIIFTVAILFLFALISTNSGAGGKDEFQRQRQEMVSQQLALRGVEDRRVRDAMATVPRHLFVQERYRGQAYEDYPLPIGHGQTISQPYIVGFMTEIVKPKPSHRVLEIGTGSGYQAAVLSELVDKVYTIEIVPELARAAANRLRKLGYGNVEAKQGDGYFGWPDAGPFDAIVVTAAAEFIPPPLIEQLKEGGRLIIPVGSPFFLQHLVLVEKSKGKVTTQKLMPVRFVPFRRTDEQ